MGVRVTVPPMRACGNNAAMISIPALRSYLAGNFAPLTLDAQPNAPLGTWSTPDAPRHSHLGPMTGTVLFRHL